MFESLSESIASACLMTSMVACGHMDPCSSINGVLTQVGITDKARQSAITQAACNTKQPVEFRQVMISTLYQRSDKSGNAKQAVKWATYAKDVKKSYITYLALYQAQNRSLLEDVSGYENSDEYKLLRDQAARYGVKSAIQHKIVSINYAKPATVSSASVSNQNPDDEIQQMAWSVIGTLDFSGGDAELSGLDDSVKDAIKYLQVDEDSYATRHFRKWYDYELNQEYLMKLAPAMDVAPTLVAVSIDLSAYKELHDKSTAAIEADKERRIAEERNLRDNPYSVEVSCMYFGKPHAIHPAACVEEFEISSAGFSRSYSRVDMIMIAGKNRDKTSFEVMVPQHFEALAQQRDSALQVYLVVKDRKSQKIVFQGNTGGKYDVVSVKN